MPLDPSGLLGFGLNLGGQLLTNSINNRYTQEANRETQNFQLGIMNQQRQWSLADWNMQNEYNSPVQQRARMLAAGENPALMWGAGSSGVSTPVRAGYSPNYQAQPKHADINASAAMMAYLGIQKQTAELDQMRLQNDLLRAKIPGQYAINQLTIDKSALTVAQAAKVQSWLDGLKQYDEAGLGNNVQGQQLGYQATSMMNQTGQQNAQWTLTLDENTRRNLYAAKNAENIADIMAQRAIQNAKTQQEIENLKANLDLLKKSGVLRQIDIDGNRFMEKTFGGVAGQLLQGLLKRADIIR